MKQYRLIIAYDGTDYAGWMPQVDRPSVMQTLMDAFEGVFHHPLMLLGASKTDAGVHAHGQVAVCTVPFSIDSAILLRVWNKALPKAISIISLEEDAHFNPHSGVVYKEYHYHIFAQRPHPFHARYGWHIPYPFSMKKLLETVILFRGTHNFNAFYTGNDRKDTMRTIQNITLDWNDVLKAHRIIVRGERFLHHMVRRMIGASCAVASHAFLNNDDIVFALKSGNKRFDLPVAPACGLTLHSITYDR